jgi:TDG/mug DNA glycosylase family protein
VDQRSVRVYERQADAWIDSRGPGRLAARRIAALVRDLPRGAIVGDLGCGPGWHLRPLLRRGLRALALDASAAMLERAPASGRVARVQADLAALPLARGSLDAAYSLRAYQHLPLDALSTALAQLHGALQPGAGFLLSTASLEGLSPSPRDRTRGQLQRRLRDDAFPGRLFSGLSRERLHELLRDAGFEQIEDLRSPSAFWLWLRAHRRHTLPDYVRPRLDLLICGLNPSPFAADTGIPFGRAGNRFWPAARAAGLIQQERDPFAALERGIGFTDLCKRPTRAADELRREEHAAGLVRLENVVRRLRPRAICFVGLDGWRRAVDAHAGPGWVERGFAGAPAYLMPSTSGRNAHARLRDLTRHLRRAYTGSD